MKSLRILLEGAIDYAGLFPPASLEMPEVIRNYAAYRDSPDAWALGRFVVPLANLHEVAEKPWPFSLLAGPGDAIPPSVADVVEIKAAQEDQVRAPAGMTAYFEAPEDLIPAIAAAGGRAKIRMGGISVPDAKAVARFMVRCSRERIGFKATAGLHRPFRGGNAHGFINTLVAACLVWQGAPETAAIRMLEERSPAAFRFYEDGLAWRDHCMNNGQIADARRNFIAGFGSCSFEEPLRDLRELRLL